MKQNLEKYTRKNIGSKLLEKGTGGLNSFADYEKLKKQYSNLKLI